MCADFLGPIVLLVVLLPVAAVVAYPVARFIIRAADAGAGGGGGFAIKAVQLFLLVAAAWLFKGAFAAPVPSLCVAAPVGTAAAVPVLLAGLVAIAALGRWYVTTGRQKLAQPADTRNPYHVAFLAAQDRRTAERAEFDAIVNNPATAPEPVPPVLPVQPAPVDVELIRTTVMNTLALVLVDRGLNPHEHMTDIEDRTEGVMRELLGSTYAAGARAINAAGVTLAIAAAAARQAVK